MMLVKQSYGHPGRPSGHVDNMCVESDWPSSQTLHSSEQRCRSYFWSQPKVSTRRRVVTEDRSEMKQQEGNE